MPNSNEVSSIPGVVLPAPAVPPILKLPPDDDTAKVDWKASLRDQMEGLLKMTPERMATLLALAGQNLEQIKRDAEKEPPGRSATRKLLGYVRRQIDDGTFEFFRTTAEEAYPRGRVGPGNLTPSPSRNRA